MSAANPCGCSCATPETVSIPGVAGENAFTVTTATFVVPALGNNVTVAVVSSDFAVVGQSIYIGTAGIFTVISKPTATSLLVQYSNIASNTAAGNTIASGVGVAPGGAPGSDGSNGGNAYTITAADFVVPAIAGSVAITVGDSSFMVVNENVYVGGAGIFKVTAKSDATHFTGQYLDYSGNTHATETITSGAGVTPGGSEPTTPITVAKGGTNSATATLARAALGIGGENLSVYASGSSYQLTATPAALNFGGTDPTLTITSAGVWLILACVRVDYTGATFAAVRTGTLKLRRTNNTAADLTNGSRSFLTDIITTLTYTLGVIALPPVIYTTTNNSDALTIFGDISVIPTAGSIDASQCEIVAIKLYNQTV